MKSLTNKVLEKETLIKNKQEKVNVVNITANSTMQNKEKNIAVETIL
jgi:hypothetical protein